MEDRSLLVSDLDGTLLGDDAATERFRAWYRGRRDAFILAYASGRFYQSVVDSIRSTALPQPLAIIGGVGTQIHWFPSGDVAEAWRARFDSTWDAGGVASALDAFSELERQPDEFQSPHKVSYYLRAHGPDCIAAIRSELAKRGIAADVIYSSSRDLDIVPRGVNKGTAAGFLARALGVPSDRVIVSGDSGNDASMFVCGFRGVIPANAHAELRALAGTSHYLASASFADGVLEGIDHWRKVAGSE